MATDRDAQYDNSAKRLIAHKIIVARILVKTVEEFKGMDPLEVAALIEGLPYISAVPVEPGLTNAVHFVGHSTGRICTRKGCDDWNGLCFF